LKYLPSTKIVILILVTLVAGGIFLFAKGGDALWKSVVFDRGINDGNGIVVVSNGKGSRSPEQPQGSWENTLDSIVGGNPGGGSYGSENITNKLLDGIVAKNTELQSQDDKPLNEQSTQDVARSIVNDLPDGNIAIIHTSQEFSISNDSSALALKTYGETLASIFTKYSKDLTSVGYEITIVEKAINTNDSSGLAKLPVIESLYKNVVNDLITTKVPKDAEKIHLNLANAYEVAISSIRDMESAISDPAKALVGISRYRIASQIIQSGIVDLNSLFKTRGVIFEQGNTGFIFS